MDDLNEMSLQELRDLADRVGVGYWELEEDQLRERLVREGRTH